MQAVGEKMMLAGGALDAAIGLAASHAATFQTATVALVTGAGESQAALAGVQQGLLSMASEVGVNATDLASGLYMIESAGYHGAAGLQVMEAAAKGARIGMADQETVADAVTSALNAYHLSADQATGVTGQLIQTVASGKMHFQDLAASLGTVLPAAATAHVSLQEVGAALATMTMQGTPAADAATYLRQTLLQLQNPTAKAQKAIESLGFGAHDLANMLNEKGLLATLTAVQDALQKKFPQGGAAATATLADIVGGTKSMQAALELTGSNLGTFKSNVKSVGDALKGSGDAVQGWAMVEGTAADQFEKLKASLDATTISIGLALLPILQQLMAAVEPILQTVQTWVQAHSDLVAKVLLGAAAFLTIGGAILTFGGTIAIALAALNPVTLVIMAVVGAVGALAAAWATNFGGIRDIATSAFGAVTSFLQANVLPVFQQVIAWVRANWPLFQATISAVIGNVMSVFNTVRGWVSSNWPVIETTITRAVSAIVGAFDNVRSIALAYWGEIQATVSNVAAKIQSTFGNVVGWAQTTWPQVQATVSTAMTTIQNVAGKAVSWVEANWPRVQATALSVVDNIRAKFNEVSGWLQSTWQTALGKVGDALNGVSNVLQSAFGPALDTAVRAWDQFSLEVSASDVPALLSGLGNEILTGQFGLAMSDFKAIVSEATESLTDTLQPSIQAVTNVVNQLGDGWKIVNDGLKAAATIIGPLLRPFVASLNNALDQFKSLASSVPSILAPLGPAFATLGPAMSAMGDALNQLWQLISPLLLPALRILGEVIGGILVADLGFLLSILGGVVGALTGILPGAIMVAKGVIEVFAGIIEVFAALFKGEFSIIADLLRGNFSQAWIDAQETIRGVAKGIEDINRGLSDVVIGIITGLVGGVEGLVSGFVNTFIGYFKNLYDELVGHSIVPDLAASITSIFENLFSDLLGKVGSFVGSFVGHFQSLAGQVGNIVGNLTSGAGQVGVKVQSSVSAVGAGISVPALGTGGIVTSPMLALVGDKPEAVVPLNQGSIINEDSLAAKIAAAIAGAQSAANVSFEQHIHGGDPATVQGAAQDGVMRALRAMGMT